ncbi:Malate dehydrogenase 2, partial [Durusdinium trenchii]
LWEPYVELHYSSVLSYLAFLSEELRYRRKELNLTWKDKGLDIETSLHADAWALEQIQKYQGGKLVLQAWIHRGMTSFEDLAEWRFDGNLEAAKQSLENTQGAMQALYSLDELPALESADKEAVKQSQQELLEGEFASAWSIQALEDGSHPIPLPDWFQPAINRTILIWKKEASVWESRLAKRQQNGKNFYTPKQQEEFDDWKKTWCRRIILDKRKKIQILNFQKKNLLSVRGHCLVLEVQLSHEATDLKIRSGNGPFFQLKLLQVQAPTKDLPPEVDQSGDDMLEDCCNDDQDEVEEEHELDEREAVMQVDECEEASPVDLDGFEFHCCSEDSENEDANLVHGARKRVHTAEEREEFKELKAKGLTLRPPGTTVGVHPQARVWRAYCQDSTYFGRSWGGTSGRSPKQALLLVFRLMLGEHVKLNPADHFARKQCDRVHKACMEAGICSADMERAT